MKVDMNSDHDNVGIMRLDGANYSAPVCKKDSVLGDLAAAATFTETGCEPFYERIEGYTFTCCQFGFKDIYSYTPNFEGQESTKKDEDGKLLYHSMAAEPELEKEGIINIRGSKDNPNHVFVPNRRPGASNQPRPRQPSRTEDWLDESGAVIGVSYIYDSKTILANIVAAMKKLETECGVQCIVSACGFMSNLQRFCATHATVPVLLSSLELLPLVSTCCGDKGINDHKILVITASDEAFNANYDELVKPDWRMSDDVLVVGLDDVEGFGDEVKFGTTVDVVLAEKNILAKVQEAIKNSAVPVRAIVSECTELPGYTNVLRRSCKLPVYDAVTVASMLIAAVKVRECYAQHAMYS